MIAVTGGTVITPHRRFDPGAVVIDGSRIADVGSEEGLGPPEDCSLIDATGRYVVPGFIDLHTHGLLGDDVMGPGLAEAIRSYPRHGITSFMATTQTAPEGETVGALEQMAAIMSSPPNGAVCLGIHLEGPHLSPDQPGMARPELFKPLVWEDFERLQAAADGAISMITLAPEVVRPMELLTRLRDVGVLPVVGHSSATFDQMAEAVRHGLNHASHTYNAMGRFHHREPGVVGAVLHFDSIFAEIIADGIHLHPAAISILVKAKGVERTVLVSDSAPIAGLSDGEYSWRDEGVRVRAGRCELADGTLAGSASPLDVGLRSLTDSVGLTLDDALITATESPARSVGLESKGRLAPGFDADLVLLDEGLHPTLTMIRGEVRWTQGS